MELSDIYTDSSDSEYCAPKPIIVEADIEYHPRYEQDDDQEITSANSELETSSSESDNVPQRITVLADIECPPRRIEQVDQDQKQPEPPKVHALQHSVAIESIIEPDSYMTFSKTIRPEKCSTLSRDLQKAQTTGRKRPLPKVAVCGEIFKELAALSQNREKRVKRDLTREEKAARILLEISNLIRKLEKKMACFASEFGE